MSDKKSKVLLIEDDRFISKMYQTKLDLEGYEVESAENGEEGVKKAKSFSPDIILLDILMPEMDGFGVLEALNQDPDTKKIPVIVMSNLGQEEHVNKAISLGAKDYIVKSQYTPSAVLEKIKENLGK